MNHPLPNEADAFRGLLLVAGESVVVVAAHQAGGGIADIALLAFVSVAVLARLIKAPRGERPDPKKVPPRPNTDRHRILVVATTNDTRSLAHDVRVRADAHGADVMLVCPALNSRLAHWVSDVDGAEAAARRRLDVGLAALADAGVEARGVVGDPNPLQAIEDALCVHGADELIVATRPPNERHWLEKGVVARARRRYLMPIEHLADLPDPELVLPEYVPAPGFVAEATVLAAAHAPEAGPPMN
jgi:hypothetical protein